jgi:hypothetical protein
MANETHSDPRAVKNLENIKDLRGIAKPLPPSNPPILTNGLELPRSSHC